MGSVFLFSRHLHRLSKANSKLRDLDAWVNSTVLAVMVTDAQGRITRISPGFSQLTGFTADEMFHQKPDMMLHGQHTDPRAVETIRSKCKAGQTFKVNILQYIKGNKPLWVTTQGRPIRNIRGRVINYVITQTAMATQKAAQTTPPVSPNRRAA